MDAPTPYDIVPYPSKAYAHAHPDRMFVVGRLFGLNPRPPDGATVLELGCGAGGHLLPIAAQLPGARVIGVDLSREAIAIGRRMAEGAGLDVDLRHGDIAALSDVGQVDYLVCHGVYSWVDDGVREAILRLSRELLSPDGVAYISYNAYPGWHMHNVARDIMRVHAAGFSDPIDQAQQGKALVRFMSQQLEGSGSPYAAVLKQQATMTEQYSDAYFYHDFLSEHNHPLLLRDFVTGALKHELQYLGDSDLGLMMMAHVPAEVRRVFDQITSDLVSLEQYLDLLRGTSFRRTLLCHRERTLKRELGPSDLAGLWVYLNGHPKEGNVDLTSDAPSVFETHDDRTVTVSSRLGKAALIRLAALHPQPLPFEALCVEARNWTGLEPDPAAERDVVAGVLLHAYAVGLVDLAPRDRGASGGLTERPVCDPLARAMARTGSEAVTNRRHEMVPLTRMDQVLVSLLDGEHDVTQIMDGLIAASLDGRITVKVAGEPTTDLAVIREAMEAAMPERLDRLRRTSLLVA